MKTYLGRISWTKNDNFEDSTQTSFNFAHEEHEGSLELSAIVSTILEEDILL